MPLPPANARFLKVGVTVVIGFAVIQFWLRGLPEMRHLEPLFMVNVSHHPPWIQPPGNVTETAPLLPPIYTSDNSSQDANATASTEIPNCPAVPPGLQGRLAAFKDFITLREVEAKFPMVELGGSYHPHECRARDRVGVIVPYRDREEHLNIFLYNIHRLLTKQQIDYTVFVIEQSGKSPFNRGKLMNIGYKEGMQQKEFDCFVFHDVDLLPEDDRNLYTCPEQPRHMSVAIDKFKYKLPYKDLFGGVSALTTEHFELINGFSNLFWGWGGEDDDVSYRIRRAGLHIARYPPYVARYAMLSHNKAAPNKDRFKVMQQGKKRYSSDGLNSLTYVKKMLEKKKLFTWICVDLDEHS